MGATERRIRILKTFGKRLRAARLNAGFRSAAKFAEHLGVESHTYRHWENGRTEPNLKMLERLCGHLSITPNYLLPEAVRDDLPDQPPQSVSVGDEEQGNNPPREAPGRKTPERSYREAFNERVRLARDEGAHLTQAEMATMLGVPLTTFQKYEGSRNDKDTPSLMPHWLIENFCLICRVNITWLITGKGRPWRKPGDDGERSAT